MNRSTFVQSFSFSTLIFAIFLTSSRGADYPAAFRGPQVDDYFGTKVADPYRWMEDIDSPETAAWVAAERAATAAALAKMPERGPIERRLKALWNYPRYGLPQKAGGRLFFTRNSGLQNQSVTCVIDRPLAAPRVLIDPNTLSGEGTVAVNQFTPTDDGKLLGYGIAVAGSDWTEFHVRDVLTGKDLPDVVRWAKFSGLSWTHDGAGFFYSRFPEVAPSSKLFGKLLGEQLYYHRLGTEQSSDRLIFEIKEHPEWFFGGGVTDDGRYLVIAVEQNGKTQNGVYYADLVDPSAPRLGAPIVRLLDQFDAEYTFIGNRGTEFYLLTTLGAPRGRVVAIDVASPARERWATPVPESEDSIEEAAVVGGRLVALTQHDVQSHLAVYAADGSSRREVALPGIGSVSGLAGRADDPELYYGFSSFLIPPSVRWEDVNSGQGGVFQKPPTPFDPAPYETREVFYTSRDGTRIPLFITSRMGLKLDGSTPAWLYGYGGFNISNSPAFAVPPAVWIEMGGIYAVANLRGGGEYGESWHLAGTKERKQNVFDDFIAAADFLVKEGYTKRDRLLIEGRSNGGLLIGAVLNQRPDICAVALPGVGVMDMLRYHRFTIGAAWASDYGTSETPEGFRYLRAYSPLHNIRAGARYPAVLITTGDHDDRVFPAHSYKYAAALQDEASRVPGSGPILIRIERNAGHGGSTGTSPVSKVIEEWADKIAFAAHYVAPGTLRMPSAP
ncbi:MAG: prolyl oligopeptidase family serine peptidase [Opitutaceae bacterium]